MGSSIKWEEGYRVQHVALHAPYFLLFNTKFIEVRDMATGELCQLIPGDDVRCLCDGRGLEKAGVLAVMDVEEPTNTSMSEMETGVVRQRIVGLVLANL